MALALIKEFSLSRDGLMTINFKSNVRNLEQDIRRKQINEVIKSLRKQGTGRRQNTTEDIGETYQVSNSDPKFDLDEKVTLDEILEALPVARLQNILRTININFRPDMRKGQLVQILKTSIQQNNQRMAYIRQMYGEYLSELRRNRQRSQRDVNSTLLISNFYKYKRSDFDGMSFKEILKSLFDLDDHLIFVANRVLKGKELPITRTLSITNTLPNLRNYTTREEMEDYLEKASIKHDRILKANCHLVLELLFSPRKPFYIDDKKYTILRYHQENGPTQDPEQGLEIPTVGPNSVYSIYPVEIYLELSELPPDKITDRDIQKSSCHIRTEKMRKNWFDIWNPSPPDGANPDNVFERNHRKTLKRKRVRGGNKYKTTKKYKKPHGGH